MGNIQRLVTAEHVVVEGKKVHLQDLRQSSPNLNENPQKSEHLTRWFKSLFLDLHPFHPISLRHCKGMCGIASPKCQETGKLYGGLFTCKVVDPIVGTLNSTNKIL